MTLRWLVRLYDNFLYQWLANNHQDDEITLWGLFMAHHGFMPSRRLLVIDMFSPIQNAQPNPGPEPPGRCISPLCMLVFHAHGNALLNCGGDRQRWNFVANWVPLTSINQPQARGRCEPIPTVRLGHLWEQPGYQGIGSQPCFKTGASHGENALFDGLLTVSVFSHAFATWIDVYICQWSI